MDAASALGGNSDGFAQSSYCYESGTAHVSADHLELVGTYPPHCRRQFPH